MKPEIELLHFYIAPGHNYFGHHGRPSGTHPILDVSTLFCVAGRGIRNDRFFDHKDDYNGQITFFSHEVYRQLCHRFGIWMKPPSAFRRNVITRGIDLNSLIGHEFEIQGIRFWGAEECKPCYWMDEAFFPGTEAALRGQGGLRAKILSNGTLQL